jgi:hypothetical protein
MTLKRRIKKMKIAGLNTAKRDASNQLKSAANRTKLCPAIGQQG